MTECKSNGGDEIGDGIRVAQDDVEVSNKRATSQLFIRPTSTRRISNSHIPQYWNHLGVGYIAVPLRHLH